MGFGLKILCQQAVVGIINLNPLIKIPKDINIMRVRRQETWKLEENCQL